MRGRYDSTPVKIANGHSIRSVGRHLTRDVCQPPWSRRAVNRISDD